MSVHGPTHILIRHKENTSRVWNLTKNSNQPKVFWGHKVIKKMKSSPYSRDTRVSFVSNKSKHRLMILFLR